MVIPISVKVMVYFNVGFLLYSGIGAILFPEFMLTNPPHTTITDIFGLEHAPKSFSSHELQLAYLVGILCFSTGMVYILSGQEFIYKSVPIRLSIGLVSIATWIGMPDRVGPGLVVMALYDTISALYMGWMLGSFTGRVPVSLSSRKVKGGGRREEL